MKLRSAHNNGAHAATAPTKTLEPPRDSSGLGLEAPPDSKDSSPLGSCTTLVLFEGRISIKLNDSNKIQLDIADATIRAFHGDKKPSLEVLDRIKASRESGSF